MPHILTIRPPRWKHFQGRSEVTEGTFVDLDGRMMLRLMPARELDLKTWEAALNLVAIAPDLLATAVEVHRMLSGLVADGNDAEDPRGTIETCEFLLRRVVPQ